MGRWDWKVGVFVLLGAACSGEAQVEQPMLAAAGASGRDVPGLIATAGASASTGPAKATSAPPAVTPSAAASPSVTPPTAAPAAPTTPAQAAMSAPMAPSSASAPAMPNAAMGMAPAAGMAPVAAAGPEDGDPAQPVVAVQDVACGGPMGGFGLGAPNFKLDDRDMIVTYPCNKHAGAPVSFILNLHGTTPPEQHFYQHGYFAAHQFAATHNLLIVTPSSVVQQWGNGDNGEDEPHLMHIIDWVYETFNGPGKFDIRAMWVGGHSWGGGYTARFGCKPELADKVKGLIMMSGGGVGGFGGASCANNISAIITTAEGDGREPSDQSMLATSHGCAAGMSEMILENRHTFWPMCNQGFVHANYYMLGKEHATFMDKEVVESIVNWIKLQRQ